MNLNERAFGYIVLFLGIALLMCVGGMIGLLAFDKPVDDILKVTTGALTTGLLGLLVKTPTQPPVDEAN